MKVVSSALNMKLCLSRSGHEKYHYEVCNKSKLSCFIIRSGHERFHCVAHSGFPLATIYQWELYGEFWCCAPWQLLSGSWSSSAKWAHFPVPQCKCIHFALSIPSWSNDHLFPPFSSQQFWVNQGRLLDNEERIYIKNTQTVSIIISRTPNLYMTSKFMLWALNP